MTLARANSRLYGEMVGGEGDCAKGEMMDEVGFDKMQQIRGAAAIGTSRNRVEFENWSEVRNKRRGETWCLYFIS